MNGKPYHYLLFDLDGTLTEPKEGITKSVQYALAAFGISVADPDELIPFIGPPLVESFQKFYGFDAENAVKARNKYRERYETVGIYENAVIEGIPELLRDLKDAGYILALATSKPEPMAVRVMEHFGLDTYFSVMGGSRIEKPWETKADVIHEVFRRLGVTEETKNQALMIGDRLHDIDGAKECGIDSMGVYFGYAEQGELEEHGADYLADTVQELREFLLGQTEKKDGIKKIK